MKIRYRVGVSNPGAGLFVALFMAGLLSFALLDMYRTNNGATSARPVRLDIEYLPIDLRELTHDGRAPNCSPLAWRETVFSAVCFGDRGEFLVEYVPGARKAQVMMWNQ